MMKRMLLGLLAGMLLLGTGSTLFARVYTAKRYTRRGVAPRRISRADYVPHELLVKYKSGTPDFVRKEIDRGASARVLGRFSGDSRLEHIRLPENENLDAALAYYSSRADVEYAQKNFIYRPVTTPNDLLYGGQWALAHMNAPTAWDKTTGRFTVVVALIDTGVDYTHPDLALNIWTNPAEAGVKCTDGVNDDPQNDVDGLPFVDDCRGWNFWDFNNDPMDLIGHGTEMAGAIGAMGNDAIGIAGANWDIQIMPLKVTAPDSSSTTAVFVQAIDYAIAHGANLINFSMGAQTSNFDYAFRDAIVRTQNAGELFITGAGNNGLNTDVSPFYPCNFSQASIYDANPPTNIVCAAATNESDLQPSFSNYGSAVQLSAPGTDIVTTMPLSLSVGDPYIVNSGGTSFSAAFVTGGAALLKGCNASLTFDAIKDILLTNVTAAGLSTSTGGIVNYSTALADSRVGTCDSTATTSTPVADPGGPYASNNTRKAVFFDATNSYDTGGNLLLYYWDFGDGTFGVGPQATHFYPSRGIYTARLYVRDDQGVVASQTVNVNVGHYHPHPPHPFFQFLPGDGRSDSNGSRGGGLRYFE